MKSVQTYTKIHMYVRTYVRTYVHMYNMGNYDNMQL